MGEKIRDVHPIHLANGELMVELNEGYTARQGRVIHIQNKAFRYLLKESEFAQVASLIMRAEVETAYIKEHYRLGKPKEKTERKSVAPGDFSLLPALRDVADYRIVALRDRLVTLIVPQDKVSAVKKALKKRKAKEMPHPLGAREGYLFLYQMEPFSLFRHKGRYYEIFCQLPCMSLTPKTFIPLDRKVQQAVWKVPEGRDGYPFLQPEEAWIYRLVTCLFYKRCFDGDDASFFTERRDLLDRATLAEKLELIVFRFTPTLFQLIREEAFDRIVSEYFSFTDY